MNEVKFRAWDIKRKIYGTVYELSFPVGENDEKFPDGHKGRVSLYNPKNEADCGFWGSWIENVELEQYTGLKDCNNYEIFEGDILGDPNVEDDGVVIIGLVYKDEESGRYYAGDYCGEEFIQFLVIGNHYENSELLEEK